MPREPFAGALVEDGATAEGQHPVVVRQRRRHCRALQGTELRLTRVHEDVRDRPARCRLDVLVTVAEADPPRLGEDAPDRRLARPHRADEDDPGPCAHLNRRVSR